MSETKNIENKKSEFEINEESKYIKTYIFIKGYAYNTYCGLWK